MQCDTRLRLENIPTALQAEHGLAAAEDATFSRLDHGLHRDGVRFRNGVELSLQSLRPGVTATVTQLLENAAPVAARSDLVPQA
jgi:hypothetical protein